jgi:hypothetical protein
MIEVISAILLLGSLVYVFSPMRQAIVPQSARKSRLEYLRERKEVIYDNLRDLNFEYKAGKIPDADYLPMRDSLERDAATVLAEIEDLERSI